MSDTGKNSFSLRDFDPFDLVVFDLDDTLYREIQYLDFAYRKIADDVCNASGIEAHLVYEYLLSEFRSSGRQKLFDKLSLQFSLHSSQMESMLKILRTVQLDVKMPLSPFAQKAISHLVNHRKKIAVLTNGNPIQQKNKVEHIDWKTWRSYIYFVYANDYKPKPSPDGLLHILTHFQIPSSHVLFIGDSEEDRLCAQSAQVLFKNIREIEI